MCVCVKRSVSIVRQLEKVAVKKAQAKVVKCAKNKSWVPRNPPWSLKGCGMGTWLVLVSPCFRENVVATCKIGSFLCNLDNLLQKYVVVFFFGNQISKWRSFDKRAILTYFSHFLVPKEKLQKILQHISHSHTYTYFAHPIDVFCLTNFEKNTNLSGTVSLWYES